MNNYEDKIDKIFDKILGVSEDIAIVSTKVAMIEHRLDINENKENIKRSNAQVAWASFVVALIAPILVNYFNFTKNVNKSGNDQAVNPTIENGRPGNKRSST
jgi:hypothetical protein